MAITEVFLSALSIEAAPVRRCYTKQRWAEPWIEQPYFHPLACRFAAAPDLPQGSFEWRYGEGMQAGAGGYNPWGRSDSLLGWYAKIEIGSPPQVTWIGTVTDCEDDRHGALVDAAGSRTPTGIQRFTALGLEFALRRQVVDHAWVWDAFLGTAYRLPRAVAFNEPNRAGNAGNRSLVRGPKNTYLFAEDLNAGQATWWRTIDIVEYLLAYHAPLDRDGVMRIPFRVADASYGVLPDWDEPVLEAQGRSVAELLDALIDRRRFFGYRFALNAAEEPALEAFTFTDETIALGAGRHVFESIRQVSLDFDRAAVVRSAVLRDSEVHRCDQVVCQGARIVVCGSLSAADGTLEADWTAAEQTAYNDAAGGVAGYAASDRHVQERWNSEVRGGDDLARVFTAFRLPTRWDRRLGNGLGGIKEAAFPDPDVPGTTDAIYRAALRFLGWLPIADAAAAAAAGAGTEFRRPFAVLKLADGAEFDEYQVLDRVALDAGTELTGDGSGLPFSAAIRPAEHDAAVWLTISGWPQHALAAADYTPLAADAELTPAVADWRTDLIVTVAFEIDRHLTGVWPAAGQLPAVDTLRRMVIDFGDAAQGHWLTTGTVLGTEQNGRLIQATGARWLTNDTLRLTNLARVAFAWYSQPRQALELTVRRIFNGLVVGDLLVEIGAGASRTTIKSVVTAIDYDLAFGTTRVTTNFADLDVRLL